MVRWLSLNEMEEGHVWTVGGGMCFAYGGWAVWIVGGGMSFACGERAESGRRVLVGGVTVSFDEGRKLEKDDSRPLVR